MTLRTNYRNRENANISMRLLMTSGRKPDVVPATLKRQSRSAFARFEAADTTHHDGIDDDTGERSKTMTAKQGQYLAFIYYYAKIHGIAPAEADFRRYFRVSPPVVHQMILTLERRGFIEREPAKARSIKLRLTRAELPDLE